MTIPRGQSHMVGSWETVVIATLHTDLVHNLAHNYVSIKPSSSWARVIYRISFGIKGEYSGDYKK
jgi:hypothetical protein